MLPDRSRGLLRPCHGYSGISNCYSLIVSKAASPGRLSASSLMRIPTATSGVPSYGTSLLFSFSEIASNRGEVFKTGINKAEILRKVYLVQKMT